MTGSDRKGDARVGEVSEMSCRLFLCGIIRWVEIGSDRGGTGRLEKARHG